MPVERIQAVAATHPFWSKVAVAGRAECWLWKGSRRDRYGYGLFGTARAHRVAFELHHGTEPARGEVIRHDCDTPLCCNPMHLLGGTHLDNVQDRNERGRTARGSDNGRAVLSRDQALAIYRAEGSLASIGKSFGVAKATVRDIKDGTNWGWLTGAKSQLGINIPSLASFLGSDHA